MVMQGARARVTFTGAIFMRSLTHTHGRALRASLGVGALSLLATQLVQPYSTAVAAVAVLSNYDSAATPVAFKFRDLLAR